jgi:hypothetical protein
MTMTDMLMYRNGVKIQRQIKITSAGEDTIIIDFNEQESRRFVGKYHMIVSNAELVAVETIKLFNAWLEHDANNFHHPELTITDDE